MEIVSQVWKSASDGISFDTLNTMTDLVLPAPTRVLKNPDKFPAWGEQCRRIKRDGERCRRWAIRGAYWCPKHGGALPTVKASARARLRTLAPLALRELERLLVDAKIDPTVRLRTIRYIIMMSGIRPGRLDPDRGTPTPALPAASSTSPDDEIAALLEKLRA